MVNVYDYVMGFIHHVMTDTLDNMEEDTVTIMPSGQNLIDLMDHLKQIVDRNRSHIVSWYQYNILNEISAESLMYVMNQNRMHHRGHLLRYPTTLQEIIETHVLVYTYDNNMVLPIIIEYYASQNAIQSVDSDQIV